VITLILSPLTARGHAQLTGTVLTSIIALGCAGARIAYIWTTKIVTTWRATSAATVTYLTLHWYACSSDRPCSANR
jgi:hypothetical protein